MVLLHIDNHHDRATLSHVDSGPCAAQCDQGRLGPTPNSHLADMHTCHNLNSPLDLVGCLEQGRDQLDHAFVEVASGQPFLEH